MCIIAYKERNKAMPNRETLERCFINNSDGAGFMFVENNEVKIYKGYMSFNSFYSALLSKKYLWKSSPFVLHFRITTQGGTNKQCTHPFPLSSNMEDLKKLRFTSNIGIAHNGIIQLTSDYFSKAKESDTMLFITKYLSLIIDNIKYYTEKRKLDLIERLADSKLAILDKNGHCELIGNFIEEDGIFYSNTSYQKREFKTYTYSKCFDDNSDYSDSWTYYSHDTENIDKWEQYRTGNKYFFDIACPFSEDGDDSYCSRCYDFRTCFGNQLGIDEFTDEYEV